MPPRQRSSSSTNQPAQQRQQRGRSGRQRAPTAPTTTSTPDVAGSSAAAPTGAVQPPPGPLQPIEEEIDLTNISASEDDDTPGPPDANQASQYQTTSTKRSKKALDIKHFFDKGQETFCDPCR